MTDAESRLEALEAKEVELRECVKFLMNEVAHLKSQLARKGK